MLSYKRAASGGRGDSGFATIVFMRQISVLMVITVYFVGGMVFLREREPVRRAQPDFRLGVHLLLTGAHTTFPAAVWGEHLRYARQVTGEGGWVMQVVQVNDLDVEKWQAFLDDCFRLELRPVLRLATYHERKTGHWAAPNPGRDNLYTEIAESFAGFFAALDLPRSVWVVVGNEPNSGGEWGGRADPVAYAQYFTAVAQRLNRLDKPINLAMASLDLYAPHTNDLPFPGLSITMMDAAAFLTTLFMSQPDILRYVDFWASHVYPLGPFSGAPWEHSPQIDRFQGAEHLPVVQSPEGIFIRGVNGYQWERWYLEDVIGVEIPPILITEIGYRYHSGVFAASGDAANAALDPATTAAYIDMAIFGNDGRYPDAPRAGWTPLASDPAIMGVVYFALAGDPKNWGHTSLLRVDSDGHVIGTYPHYDVLVERAQLGYQTVVPENRDSPNAAFRGANAAQDDS